ncbi:sulfite exporter TauE/SafE family protein [Ferrimonas marina]|uniref:Probable membrane transporter protein n=1 Tax=Ferrimonas marina TaxID=299255 RepID=A0A1M5XYS8_9GAMM|nr:sulfite exporter TauE/SafE family protein [Ferrimonas marina]SHI04876.1 hypothetical protein SAMN02745129_3813 [Ferrimonas marina]
MIPLSELSLIWLVVCLGALVQSAIGFGLAVVVTPLLYLIDPSWVPGPIIMMGLLVSLFTLARTGFTLQMGILKPALLGRLPGGVLGTWLLLVASVHWLGLAIGAIVLMAVWLTHHKVSLALTGRNLFGAGVISGVFAAISAMGGPPLALLLNNNQSAAAMRNTLAGFFVFSAALSLLLLLLAGAFGWDDFFKGLWLIPPVFIGFVLGDRLVQHVNPDRLKQATLLLCASAGGLLILRSLYYLLTT